MNGEELPKDKLPHNWREFGKVDEMPDYFKSLVCALESKDYFYICLIGSAQTVYDMFYNKTEQKTYLWKRDYSLGLTFVGLDDDYLYGLIYPAFISGKYLNDPKFKPYINSEEMNPLLVKMKFNHE